MERIGLLVKGQAFIIGAIIFSLLIILAFISVGPQLLSTETVTNEFFSQTIDQSFESFNTGLEENYSASFVSTRMESYDRFIRRQSMSRGIEYESFNLVVVPEDGEAVFSNMMSDELNVSLKTDSWTNETVEAGQTFNSSFNQIPVEVELFVHDKDMERSLKAFNPRLLKHSVMDSERERWERTITG